MLEVERMVDGGDKVISCIDSEGNVVVATVYKREEKETEQHREEENEFERKENEKDDIDHLTCV